MLLDFNKLIYKNTDKLPYKKGRLVLFFIMLFSQIILLLLIYINVYISLIVFLEFVYSIIIYKNQQKKIIKLIIIALIIFLINLINQDGEILFKYHFFVITKEGLFSSFKKSIFLLLLMIHTLNTIGEKKEVIILFYLKKNTNQNMLLHSVIYFMQFFDRLTERISLKSLYKSLIQVYRIDSFYSYNINGKVEKLFYKKDIIYTITFYFICLSAFMLKYIT